MDRAGVHPGEHKHYGQALVGVLAFLGLYLSSLYNYLLFHSIAEIFSIVIACGIFMIAWNSRRFLDNNYLLFLGIAYLFIGGIDLVHTLAYAGMGVFPGFGSNLPTQLWILGRYTESISLVAALLFLGKRLHVRLLFSVYLVLTALFLVAIFYWRVFPDCFIEGVGLTSFKKGSEYLISLILAGSVALLYRNRARFDVTVFRLLTASIVLTIGSELAFTLYISVYGFSNLVGHFLKIISLYLIYRAIIRTGLLKPYDLLFRELKKREGALAEANAALERRLEDLSGELLNITDGYLLADLDGSLITVNTAAAKLLGYDGVADLSGKNLGSDIYNDPAKREELKETLARDGQVTGYDLEFKKKHGGVITVECSVRLVRDGTGKPAAVEGTFRDVTEHRKAEDELRESKQFIESIVNLSPDAIYIYDIVERRNIFSNDGIERLLGYSVEEIREMGDKLLVTLMHPDDFKIYLEETYPKYSKVKDGELIHHQYRMQHKDGQWYWLDCREIIYARQPDGTPSQVLGVVKDITQGRQAKAQVLKERNQARQYLDIAGVMLGTMDEKGTITLINRKGCRILGYEEKEILHQNWFDLCLPEDIREEVKGVFSRLMAGDIEPVEYFENAVVTKSGDRRVIAFHNTVLRDEGSRIIGVLFSGEDVTEHRKIEQEIRDLNEELEQRIRERTAELEERNRELDRFNRLFVDREIRIKELKEKVREMEETQEGS